VTRVAIVHERFTEHGGSELVVEQLARMWPDATIHAPIVDPAAVPAGLAGHLVRGTWLDRLYRPRGNAGYAHLLPLLPLAVRSIDVGDADLVLVSHHTFANRVRVRPGVPVVSYTHTPARWMWDRRLREMELGPVGRPVLAAYAATQRRPDRAAAQRLDTVVVNSHHVADRVRRWWERDDATVIPPPVDVDRFRPGPESEREPFFLVAGRLVPYKEPAVAVAAARRAGVRLVVAGDGRSRAEVDAAAGPGVDVLGAVDDATLVDLFRRCLALVFPGEEDFGIVPVEAMACGTPVIAHAVGGVLDSVDDGVTGVLYRPPSPDAHVETLARAMTQFDPARYDRDVIRAHAERFAPSRFRQRMSEVIESVRERAAR
jgi:glycosyltransferase involved in cell wall biosynthesis